jgi:hypothetical protein
MMYCTKLLAIASSPQEVEEVPASFKIPEKFREKNSKF